MEAHQSTLTIKLTNIMYTDGVVVVRDPKLDTVIYGLLNWSIFINPISNKSTASGAIYAISPILETKYEKSLRALLHGGRTRLKWEKSFAI